MLNIHIQIHTEKAGGETDRPSDIHTYIHTYIHRLTDRQRENTEEEYVHISKV